MKLKTLNYNGLDDFCALRILHKATAHMIFMKSNTRLSLSSHKIANHYCKFRCEKSSKGSLLTTTMEELHHETWKPLEGVVSCSVNYVPLSPISFLDRAAQVYGKRTSIIYGSVKYTWEETHLRSIKLASALNDLGVSRGDVVATLAPNIPAMLELHFAIPMAGAIICPLDTQIDAVMLSTLLTHSEAKILVVDYQLLPIANEAVDLMEKTHSKYPLIVVISEPNYRSPFTHAPNKYDYETLVEGGVADFSIIRPCDECDPISLNYTPGTTSTPKGVVYSHRGAYLNSLASVFIHGMREMPTYMWTLPMYQCNGWCFTWGLAIVGGTNICLRNATPKEIYDNIVIHKVSHMCGAPTILNLIVNSSATGHKRLPHKVEIMIGGAPPPPTIISKIEELHFHVSHIYGLTETYGHGTWCLWMPEWDFFHLENQVKLKARQGVKHFGMEEVDVKDPITMESVNCDGKSIGEIMFRGNTVMGGYFKNLTATEEAFKGGWFRSGDLAIKHPDGYIEVIDRLKDNVIYGGENISTIQIENVIYSHPDVLEVAVVARPDEHLGQTPCAFVKLKEGVHVSAQEIINHCRDRMPCYMAPHTVIFEDLPRNSTGKVQKSVLKEIAKKMGALSGQESRPS